MAGNRFTNQDVQNLVAYLNDAGLDKVAEKLEKRIEKSQKLTRSLVKSLEEVKKKENKLYQDRLKQQAALEKSAALGTAGAKEKLKNLKAEIKEQEILFKALEKVSIYQERHTKEVTKGNKEHSKTPGILKSVSDSITRHISVLGALDLAIRGISSLYDNWFNIQREITEGMGNLAQRTGATSAQLREFRQGADRMRETMTRIGGSLTGWAESFEFVSSTAIALRTDMSGLTEEFQMELLAAQRGLGMTADQAAQIVRTLEAGTEDGNESLGDFILSIRQFSEEIGANSSTIAQDYANARDSIARFGADGGQAFRNAAQFANHFGFETRRILDMSKQFDSFGNASESVNQLNAMFGTTISSLELMQEQDPVRQLEMITGAIREQGWTWENMTRQQRTALAQRTGFSEDEIGRIMRGETMEQIQAEQARRAEEQAAAAARQAEAQETIYDIIIATNTAFRSWREYLQMIFNDVSEELSPIFDAIHGSAEGTMNALRGWVQRIAQNPDFQNTVRRIADWFSQMPSHIERFAPTWEEIRDTAVELWPVIRDFGNMLIEVIRFAVEHPEAIAIALGVGAAIRLGSSLASAFATIQAITAAGPGMTAAFAGLAGVVAPLAAVGGAYALASAAEDRRVDEGRRVRERDMGMLGDLQRSAEQELRRRAHHASQGFSARLDGGSDYFTDLGEGLGIIGGQEADQRRGSIENIIDDFIRPGNKNPANAVQQLLSILGPDVAAQIAERNGASSFEDYVRSRYMQDAYLRDAFWQSLGLQPPGASEMVPVIESTAESSSVSAVSTAPATDTTTSTTRRATTTGGVEIVAADVILDGNRVGQAFFNIAQR